MFLISGIQTRFGGVSATVALFAILVSVIEGKSELIYRGSSRFSAGFLVSVFGLCVFYLFDMLWIGQFAAYSRLPDIPFGVLNGSIGFLLKGPGGSSTRLLRLDKVG